MITVVEPGPLTCLQDRGRPGLAALGVPRSGAFDRAAAALANRLVGNGADAAVLEVLLGGLVLRVDVAVTVALAGAHCPGVNWGAAVSLPAGTLLRLGPATSGLRAYLAVRGGWDAPAELGSRSTDTLSGLGPPPLRAGDVLFVGGAVAGPVSGAHAAAHATRHRLRITPGPRSDWFADDVLARLAATDWRVRSDSDRIGLRLDGPPLPRVRTGELPSEPTRPGALQVPPDGRPILFGPDAPVTGGYPVVAVVRDADLDAAAQVRPGDVVRFTP